MDVRRVHQGAATEPADLPLCSDCHRVTRYGYAQVSGHEAEAFAHLVAVTGMTPVAAREHIDTACALW